jgi:type I restriction enzyme R subunit
MSRRICIKLHDAIVKLKPDWYSKDYKSGSIKIVMTGAASDPPEWQEHIRNKKIRDELAKRARNFNDELKIVIVLD